MTHGFPHFWVRPTDKMWEARRKEAAGNIRKNIVVCLESG
jgi:hypothetical protein